VRRDVTAFGGIETGGSKWECAIGSGPDDLRATETITTTTPEAVMCVLSPERIVNGGGVAQTI
jgi:hypothetical protein